MNYAGAGAWRAYSAGSRPTGSPNPFALEALRDHGVDVGSPRSKSWDEFAIDDAPVMNVIATVCDNAAGEVCPVWPTRGRSGPERLHWSFPDPAAVEGNEARKREAFAAVFADIRRHIDAFIRSRP